MTSNVIRDLIRAAPFKPFTLHVAGGRSFRVEHPETIALLQSGRMVFFNTRDEDYVWIDVFLITDIESTAPQQTV